MVPNFPKLSFRKVLKGRHSAADKGGSWGQKNKKLVIGRPGYQASRRDGIIFIFIASIQHLAYHPCTRDICWVDEQITDRQTMDMKSSCRTEKT